MTNLYIVLGVAIFIWAIEHVSPNVALPKVKHWYLRAFAFNLIQALVATSGTYLWDSWFLNYPLFNLREISQLVQIIIGYVVITFIYYWWHRIRHNVPLLWRFLHQFHHSPSRIEVITSFYKNPIEIILNALLTSAILYILLGISPTAVGLCVLMTALAELVYHMNIKTPHIMGYVFQRPEMHRIHHQQGVHHFNYSDLPLWDMLFGTYKNPPAIDNLTGFPDNSESRVFDLIKGVNFKS